MNKTWISTTGEVFEGSKNALMKAKGIKQKNGFSRPAGALDMNGDRWLSEEKFNEQGGIRKQILFAGNRVVDGCIVTPSEIAGNYLAAKNVVENNPDHPHYDDYVELMKTVEAQYEVIVPNQEEKRKPTKLAPRSYRIQVLMDKNDKLSFDDALEMVMRSEAIALSNGLVLAE